ncbi:uncharacterized protein LOC143923363 isoform X2 [Lithobates pipiens]
MRSKITFAESHRDTHQRGGQETRKKMTVQKLKVRIFSRDGKENYKWLLSVLQSAMFQSLVGSVSGTYITNNFRSFTDDLTDCTFAILYHTKKRGRLNIANITDSLYDEELGDLKSQLGKNVIVLLDDLDDSSDGNMRRILQEQPLIEECAEKLILISELEKHSANLTGPDLRMSSAPISQRMQDAYDSIQTKIKIIRSVMEEAVGVSPERRKPNLPYIAPGPRNDSSSDSDTRSEGYKSSVTTKSDFYRQQDLDDVRSSLAYSSERSNQRLINPHSDQRDGIPANREETHIPIREDDGQMHNKRQKTPSRRQSFSCGKNISDKMVFFIIGGIVGLLLIILIIILCVTL